MRLNKNSRLPEINAVLASFFILTAIGASAELTVADRAKEAQLQKIMAEHCSNEPLQVIGKTVVANSVALILDLKARDGSGRYRSIEGFGVDPKGLVVYAVRRTATHDVMPAHVTVLEQQLPELERRLFGKNFGVYDADIRRYLFRSDEPRSRYYVYVQDISADREQIKLGENPSAILGRKVRVHDAVEGVDIATARHYYYVSGRKQVVEEYCPQGARSLAHFLTQVFVAPD